MKKRSTEKLYISLCKGSMEQQSLMNFIISKLMIEQQQREAALANDNDCSICRQPMTLTNSIVACTGSNHTTEHRFHPRCIEIFCRLHCQNNSEIVYQQDDTGIFLQDEDGQYIILRRDVTSCPRCPLCKKNLTAPENPPGTPVPWTFDPPRGGYYFDEPLPPLDDRGNRVYQLAIEENHELALINNDILSEPRLIFGL